MTLTKADGAATLPSGVTKMRVGISWDRTGGGSGRVLGALKRKKGTDLDLIAIAMQGDQPVRMAYGDSLDPMKNGSIVHTGDNKTGAGEGDDESVICDFTKVPGNVTSMVFVAAAFKPGSSFKDAANISFKVYDDSDNEELCDIWPSLLVTGNACAIAKVVKNGGSWDVHVINEMGQVTQSDQNALMRFAMGK